MCRIVREPLKADWPRLLATIAGLLLAAMPRQARAGMPRILAEDIPRYLSLTEMSRSRIEAISFFVFVSVLCGAAIHFGWNSLQKDFPRLPRLSFVKSMGLLALWGLLFVLVLTMISGARELMTPGAWESNGSTYQLRTETEGKVSK
jgi:hypothetical protein